MDQLTFKDLFKLPEGVSGLVFVMSDSSVLERGAGGEISLKFEGFHVGVFVRGDSSDAFVRDMVMQYMTTDQKICWLGEKPPAWTEGKRWPEHVPAFLIADVAHSYCPQ